MRWYSVRRRWVLIALLASLLAACGSAALTSPTPRTTPSIEPTALAPSAPASVAAGASAPAGDPIPASLRYRWIGDPRDVPVLGRSTRTGITFAASAFEITGTEYGFDGIMKATATVSAPGQLILVATRPEGGCQAGDTGTYTWSLSPGGTVLTVGLGSDPCASRASLVPGTWARIACKNPDSGCLGDLEAGPHRTQYIAPRLGSDKWAPDLGAVTYTVPAGWSNSADWARSFTLTPSPDYALEGPEGPTTYSYHEIDLFVDPAAVVDVSTCSTATIRDSPRTVDGLVGFVRSQPAVVASKPSSIVIDGHAGQMIDVHLASSWKRTCPDNPDGLPGITVLADVNRDDPWQVGLLGSDHSRFIFLDLGDNQVLLIVVASTDTARFDTLVAQSMPIITSFHFK